MKQTIRICGSLLSCSLLGASAAAAEVALESSQLTVVFDGKTQTPALIRDKINHDQQQIAVSEDFWFGVSKDGADRAVTASNSTIASADLAGPQFTVVYTNPLGTVTVRHRLGQAGHYLLKTIEFAPAFAGDYALKRVKTMVFTTGDTASRVVHQHGAGAYTYFLRKANSGCFYGVQVIPGIPISTADGAPVELQYEANLKLAHGEPYAAAPSFIGCYAKTGHTAPAKLPAFGRCVTSPVGLDDGEAEAVRASPVVEEARDDRAEDWADRRDD